MDFDADLTAKVVAAYGPKLGVDYAAAALAAYAQRTGHTRQAIEAELVARKLVARVAAGRVATVLWDLFTATSAR